VRFFGLDVHLDFCEIAVAEGGKVSQLGRIASTPGSASQAQSQRAMGTSQSAATRKHDRYSSRLRGSRSEAPVRCGPSGNACVLVVALRLPRSQ
jgi:hypothetical protein